MLEREITPHPDEQRSYAELRAEFRSTALLNLRQQFTSHHDIGWSVIGDPRLARVNYSAEEWARELDWRLAAPVVQDFGLRDVPTSVSVQLEDLAQKSALHESVTWDDGTEGVIDHDAPPLGDLATMTDDAICDYVDSAIKESERE